MSRGQRISGVHFIALPAALAVTAANIWFYLGGFGGQFEGAPPTSSSSSGGPKTRFLIDERKDKESIKQQTTGEAARKP
jgi:hypothetical protein